MDGLKLQCLRDYMIVPFVWHQISRSAALRLYLRSIWNADSRVILVPVALGLCFIDEISRDCAG
jgi:hypothetical protein